MVIILFQPHAAHSCLLPSKSPSPHTLWLWLGCKRATQPQGHGGPVPVLSPYGYGNSSEGRYVTKKAGPTRNPTLEL